MADEAPVYTEPLTPREQEVVLLLAQEGLSNHQIGERLHIVEKTVEKHLEKVYQKLGFTRRAEVIIWAWQHLLKE